MKLIIILSFVPVLLSWLLPNNYRPWSNFYSDLAMVVGFVALSFSLRRVFMPKVVFFWLGVSLLPFLQLYFGIIYYGGDALVVAFYLIVFCLSLILGFSLSNDKLLREFSLNLFMGVVVFAATVSFWMQCHQWLLQGGSIWTLDLQPGGRPYANIGQPNNLATLLSLGLVGIMYFHSREMLGSLASSLLAMIFMFGIALTQSRTPWLGAACVVAWWGFKGRDIEMPIRFRVVLVWVAVLIMLVAVVPLFAIFIDIPLQHSAVRFLAPHRLDMWSQMWQAIMQGSWWGYGWNQVTVAQSAVALDYPIGLPTEHAHNIVLDLMIWCGPLVGGVISIISGAWLFSLAFRVTSQEAVLLMLAVGLVVMHGLLEFPLEYAYFLLPVGFFIGFIECENKNGAIKINRGCFNLGGVLLVVLCFEGWSQYRMVEEDIRSMRFEVSNIGSNHLESTIDSVFLYSQLLEYLWFARAEPYVNMSFDEIDRMHKIAHRYPESSAFFRYGLALALNDNPDMARQEFLRIKSLYGDKDYDSARNKFQALSLRYPELKGLMLFD
jgi:O-antigen ligase